MKIILAITFVAYATLLSVADTAPVVLTKAAEALKQSHMMHDKAITACTLKPEHEIGWDFIERHARELAEARDLPAASKTVEVLSELRVERRALTRDLIGCAFKTGHTKTTLAIIEAIDSLDDAAGGLEINISDRAWNMEKGLDYCRAHPAN